MPKTILILTANPTDTTQLNLTQEIDKIAQELQRHQPHHVFAFKSVQAVTPAAVRQALLDFKPQFVHFSGHGAAEQGLILEDDEGKPQYLSTEALTQVFKPFANQIECVILNACFTAVQASAIVKQIDYVIGMNQPIGDTAAIQFAMGFYDAIAAGESIATAFEMGCYSIAAHSTADEHLKPVLKKRYPQPVFHVPIPENRFFTGRESALRHLQETLHFRHAAALSGLGGIGKTQTAAHYASLHRHEYQAVLWTLADTVESLKLGLVEIAIALKLPETGAPKQQDTIVAVRKWLQTHQDWLLIFDNADDIQVVSTVLPDAFGNNHRLFTTRAQTTEHFAQQIPLSTLSKTDSAHFLLSRALDKPRDSSGVEQRYASADRAVAIEIAKTLDYLPLALDQAGAYIRETQCGLDGYLKRYRTQAAQLLDKRGPLASQHDHPDTVAKTWLLSFDKIANENAAASDILYLCAFLPPDNIVEEIFSEIDAIELNKALTVIFKYSLLHREPNTQTLSIHRLVQLMLKQGLAEAEQRIWAEKAVRAVNSAFPGGNFDVSEWNRCERLLPCAQTSAALIEEWQLEFAEASLLLNQMAYYLYGKAEYAQAKPLSERALAIFEQVHGKEHPSVATSLNNLALLYQAQGAYEQAKPLYERALAIYEQVHGKEHPFVATTLNNLAELYRAQGAYEQAKPLYERALAIKEKVYGKEHPSIATSLNNLAEWYRAQGAYEQAKPLYERTLAIKEKVYGKEHPSIATSLNNLASLYYAQGAYEQAKPLSERALAIREKMLGKEHPKVAQSLNNLALWYDAQGAYEHAKPLSERALAIDEKVYGKEHPDVATDLNNLANLHYAQGAYEQAKPLYERALTIAKKFFKSDHPDVRLYSENYACLLEDMEKNQTTQSSGLLSWLRRLFK